MRYFLLCVFLCISTIGRAERTGDAGKEFFQLTELAPLEEEWERLTSDALVLFDVDFTLLTPRDEILRHAGLKLVRKLIVEILENPATLEKYPDGYLHSRLLSAAQVSPVDEKFVALIHRLQEREIPAIAFTGAPSGKLGVIESLADHRIEQLKNNGFDFRSAFPDAGMITFPKQPTLEFSPVFKSGVLFASKHPKGEILKQFLDSIQWYPKKIVMVDNSIEKLRSAKQAMDEKGIQFVGFHYVAAEKLPSQLDESLAQFQFEYLAEKGEWLSDEEAKNLLACPCQRNKNLGG